MNTIKQFKIFFIGAAILFFGAFSFFNSSSIIFAQNTNKEDKTVDNIEIQYPIKELGECKNKSDCKKYCDKPENIETCIDFAEKQNLMPKEELETAKKFVASGKKGPGGCTTKNTCETYCNDLKNIDECLTFAEKSGIMGQKEFEEAKKVKLALEKGAKLPGGCSNKKECDNYCSNPDNMEECVNFAETAGFMPEEELKEAKKVVEAIKTKGVKPPSCRGKEECDAYCGEPDHFEECITFAEAAGFMTSEEAQMARKTGGKGPGGCKGKEECNTFCQKEENFETCLDFAKENGLVSEKDAELARKTGGKGPGGCKGEKECRGFCEDPDNQEICFNFAKENNLMSKEELQKMEEGKQQMKESFMDMPQEISDCLNSSLGSDFVNKLKEGTAMPSPKIGEQMRACFERMGPPQERAMPPRDGMIPNGKEIMPPNGMPRPKGEMLPGAMIPQNAPPEIAKCLKSELGENIAEQMKSGNLEPSVDINEKVKSCFEKFGSPMQQKSLEKNTENMPQEKLAPQEKLLSPQNMPQQIQCQTKEECENICRANPEKCPGFQPKSMAPPESFQKPPESMTSPENILPQKNMLPPPDQSMYPNPPLKTYEQQILPTTDFQTPPSKTITPPTSYNRPPSLLELTTNIIGLFLR